MFFKQLSLNPIHQRFSKQGSCQNFNIIVNFDSIFNNFYTINANIVKPTPFAFIHQKFFNNTKSTTKGIGIWEISP
jgi:hypothetical protein